MSTLVERVERQVSDSEHVAFSFLVNDEELTSKSYKDVVEDAKKLATYLTARLEPQSRILLIYPPGLDFISSFMGCLYAGMIAVPTYPIHNHRQAYRLNNIIESCTPALILGHHTTIDALETMDSLARVDKVSTESIFSSQEGRNFSPSILDESSIAFLQYTSGSTGKPKGVMVTHSNLMNNLATIKTGWGLGENKTSVLWLPFQHDLGLIGGVLSSFYNKSNLVLLSPVSVIEKPYRWLKALSDFKAYFTAGPNFAYHLCVNKITPEECATLDLSSVGYALAAAEPNRYETMGQFCTKFSSCGFKKEAYSVGYGLAENTLHATTNTPGQVSQWMNLSQKKLAQGTIKTTTREEDQYLIMSAGTLHPEHCIAIVDPVLKKRCSANTIGEVWIQSPSVAAGYWDNSSATQETFQAEITGEEGTYLRTGDLGYIHQNELYVTGRQKDLIIIDGRNIYPQDLEAVADACHEFIKPGCSAAFSIDTGTKEAIVLCVEIKRTAVNKDLKEMIPLIRQAIAERYEVALHDIKMLQPNGSFKTTSGKIQRKATKDAYLKNTLNCIDDTSQTIKNNKELAKELHNILATVLGLEKVMPQERFSELGGTSLHATLLHQKLQDYFGDTITLSPTIAFDYPTLAELTHFAEHALTSTNTIVEKHTITGQNCDIAVVGIGCRLPGKIHNIEELFTALKENKDLIEPFPKWRWDVEDYDDALQNRINQAGILEDIDHFDASFFNISPLEARQMDPQHRLVLEIAWEALESALIVPQTLNKKNVGIYIGSSSTDYKSIISKHNNDTDIDPYFVLDNASSVMAGRLAYFLGTQGPAETVDTACSSSLVALDVAVQSLQLGNTEMAIVGGVNVILYPENSIGLARANMLSPTNRCHTFAQNADGYVRAEGCVVVILKRLDQALQDHDLIHAIIESTAVNQDGASSGLTVPNLNAQKLLLQNALDKCNVHPNDIDYIEAHGSATVLGDPIECAAITAIYGQYERDRPLYIGSIKSNMGHLEAAAGITGLVKTITALKNNEILANINVEQINDKLQLDSTKVDIARTSIPWNVTNKPRRAGVSAFGFSGTNAHVILKEAPLKQEKNLQLPLPTQHLFTVSAKTEQSLHRLVNAYIAFLETTKGRIEDICYTASTCRSHFNYRMSFIVTDKNELLEHLKNNRYECLHVTIHEEEVVDADLNQLSKAYMDGKTIDWDAYYKPWHKALNKIQIPTYRFDRQHYWIDFKKHHSLPYGEVLHELLGARLPGHEDTIHFLNQLHLNHLHYLKHHQIFKYTVFPGAGFIESALAAAQHALKQEHCVLSHFLFLAPLSFEKAHVDYELSLYPVKTGEYKGLIYARKDKNDEWIHHAEFIITSGKEAHTEPMNLKVIKSSKKRKDLGQLYEQFKLIGLNYGEEFQSIDELYSANKELLVLLKNHQESNKYHFHPAILDGVFQSLAFLIDENAQLELPYLPSSLGRFECYDKLEGPIWAWIQQNNKDDRQLVVNIILMDQYGVSLAKIEGFTIRKITQQHFERLLSPQKVIDCYIQDVDGYELPQLEHSVEQAPYVVLNQNTLRKELDFKHVIYVYEGDFNLLIEFIKHISSNVLSITLITQNAFAINSDTTINPEHTRALGFWRSLRLEAGELMYYLIDVNNEQHNITAILDLISAKALPEPELIVRERIYVPRLVKQDLYAARHQQLVSPGPNMYLSSKTGIDTLHWAERPHRYLSNNQIKIRVMATALNFRDVLKVMNLYPGDAGNLGYECVGEIIEKGMDVNSLHIGQKVVVVGEGLFAGEAVVNDVQAVPLPACLTPEEGASIPIAFLTVHYGLKTLAQIKKGQKVLIHAASGGVGLGAIEIARLYGAEIYTSASTLKQGYLRDVMGIEYIYDSRNTDFAKQILEDTHGEGVDIVFNSLTGDGFIESSLSCLKKGGVFLEIGKINIYRTTQMDAARPDVKYHTLEIDTRMAEEPKEIQRELTDILALFEQGTLKPLHIRQYAINDVQEAFQLMQQSKQIGKIVLVNPSPFTLKKDNTYLITGGTGGLGLKLAAHLIDKGAMHLALTSRSPLSPVVRQWKEEQEDKGIQVTHYRVDVADKVAMSAVFDSIAQSGHSLKGIFHTAGVLQDGLFINLTESQFDSVSQPKIQGSINLHELSQQVSLDYFVLFSSITALLGNEGQSNYTAANAFMDGLATLRRQNNLPALSINWGPFGEVGMAAGFEKVHTLNGLEPLNSHTAFASMEYLLQHSAIHSGVFSMDWEKYPNKHSPYLEYLITRHSTHAIHLLTLLETAAPEDRRSILQNKIRNLLATTLNIQDVNSINNKKSFFDFGIDSLLAVDMRNRLQNILGVDHTVNSTVIFNYPSVERLAAYLEDTVFETLFHLDNLSEEQQAEDTLDPIMDEDDILKMAQEYLESSGDEDERN